MAEQDAAEFVRERLDPLLQRLALPGQRDFRARRVAGLGDAPGDRAVVGDAENHPALALHEPRTLRHFSIPVSWMSSGGTPAIRAGTAQIRPPFARFVMHP